MKKILFAVFVVMSMASCISKATLYSWHNYENIYYKYNKKRTDELQVKLVEQYQKLTQKQKGKRGVVPPGLYSEYGYLLYMTGKQEEGLKFLKEEIRLYPESEQYISRIVKQLEERE